MIRLDYMYPYLPYDRFLFHLQESQARSNDILPLLGLGKLRVAYNNVEGFRAKNQVGYMYTRLHPTTTPPTKP
jgi:hypothetical protein